MHWRAPQSHRHGASNTPTVFDQQPGFAKVEGPQPEDGGPHTSPETASTPPHFVQVH